VRLNALVMAEATLTYAVGNEAAAACLPTTLLEQRREVMDEWTAHVAGQS
jgi:hypothetical protein